MITYYNVFLILAIVGNGVRCQYQLKEYAPNHDNYESYSFSYGVSDPKSGDHKHQWERMEHGHVRGEYGLMEPDGLMRLVQYTAGPKEGFKAKVTKLAVQVAKPEPEYTQGQELYQSGQYAGERYAGEDSSGPKINENQKSILGNEQPEYVQLVDEQKINPENKIENDYENQESQHHAIISRATADRRTDTQNSRKKEQSFSNGRKRIVKKNIENDMHALHPGFTSGGMEYVSNFNLNPLNIHQLNIPEGQKQILHGLSSIQDSHQQKLISINTPRPFALHNIQNQASVPNFSSGIHPALIQFQKETSSPLQGYEIIPNPGSSLVNHQIQAQIKGNYKEQYSLPQDYKIHQNLPTSIQNIKAQQRIESHGDQRQSKGLEFIHSHPEIKTSLENLNSQHNIDQHNIGHHNFGQHYIGQYNNDQHNIDQYNIHQHNIHQPNIHQHNFQQDNIHQHNIHQEQPAIANEQNHGQDHIHSYSNNANQQYQEYSHPNIPQGYHQDQSYGQYQQTNPEINYKKNNLSTQNNYPVILVDPHGKLGLPFYPSSQVLHHIPQQEFNYEGIPQHGPNLEGKRYNNENYTDEQRAAERRYLLGETPGPLFPPPPGYTRETIWQVGDPDADPEPEILVRQLNETCAYIQANETTPGNEDGRLNIWQAGDHTAQLQEEELIGSFNITCENYTADAMANFSSGYTVLDYCWQCVRNDEGEHFDDYKGGVTVPTFLPINIGPNNELFRQDYDQDEGNKGHQQAHASNTENIAQHYEAKGENIGQNQGNYETNLEGYGQKQAQEVPQGYDNSQGHGNYQQRHGPMKVAIYPNFGYTNDPEDEKYGLYRRRSIRRQKSIKENVSDGSKPK